MKENFFFYLVIIVLLVSSLFDDFSMITSVCDKNY